MHIDQRTATVCLVAETAAELRIRRIGTVVAIGMFSVVIPVHDSRSER